MGQRGRRVLVPVAVVALGLAAGGVLLSTRAVVPGPGGAAPTVTERPVSRPPPTPGAVPSRDPFGQVDDGLQRLVDARATWQTPISLAVGRSHRIGLAIGDPGRLRTQIDQLVERAVPRDAGPVRIGPTVRVTLWADADDALVRPSEAVDRSTGSQVAMLWTWFVRPLHPARGMFFIAHVEVPSDGYTFGTDIPLTLPVHRTIGYTLHQVFSHWATWSAIVVAAATAARWLWRRRTRPGGATPGVVTGDRASVAGPAARRPDPSPRRVRRRTGPG
jgi:hypothetical protein